MKRRVRTTDQLQRGRVREQLAAWMTQPRSIEDIRAFLEAHYARPVVRRTAERHRDWMVDAFGAVPARTAAGRKGWVIRTPRSTSLTVTQTARVRRAADWLEQSGHPAWATALRDLGDAPSVEAQAEPEAVVVVPVVKVRVPPWVEAAILRGIGGKRALRARYRMTKRSESGGRGGRILDAIIHPYGLVHGERPFLVGGWDEEGRLARDASGRRRIGWYALDRFEKVATTDIPLAGANRFDLQAYVRRWFGTPRGDEEPFAVAWRFSPAVAARAALYEFHPGQRVEQQRDGSLVVRFRAAGSLEMHRHLATWGDDVEVLEPEPEEFRQRVEQQRQEWRAYFA